MDSHTYQMVTVIHFKEFEITFSALEVSVNYSSKKSFNYILLQCLKFEIIDEANELQSLITQNLSPRFRFKRTREVFQRQRFKSFQCLKFIWYLNWLPYVLRSTNTTWPASWDSLSGVSWNIFKIIYRGRTGVYKPLKKHCQNVNILYKSEKN